MDNPPGVIIIPFNYEHLHHAKQKAIIPICIASVDRNGNEIARVWFEQGVAPVQDQLRHFARYILGDVRHVSELAEVTVHKLWEQHGADAGFMPWRRVVARAIWEARELAAGGSRWRKQHTVQLELWALDLGVYGSDMTEPEEIYQNALLLELVERRIQQEKRNDIRQIFAMLREGYTWDEMADRIGYTKSDRLKKRFWRWIKRNFPQKPDSPRMPPRKHMPPPYRPTLRRMQ